MSGSFLVKILLIQIAFLSTQIESQILNESRKLQEKSNDIVIIHVNDVHCGLNDTVGYDGFVLYREELKEKYKHVISVDVGDHIQGGTLGALSEGSAIIELMNKVGFDVVTLGNHEFDYGLEQLDALQKNITSNYICANFCFRNNKSAIFEPYKIIEAGNKKIAFIGIVTPLTFSKTYLCTLRDEKDNAIYDFLADNDAKDLYDKVQRYIDEVRNDKKVDYVILLTHFGMEVEEYTSEGVLSNLKNVTAVLDGHTHRIYNVTSKDIQGKDIHITQTGTKLQNIGKLILKSDGSITSETIADVPEPSNKTSAIKITRDRERWVNKEINEYINNLWGRYEEELNTKVGFSDYDFIIKPTTSSNKALSNVCRYRECSLGNLLADAIKEAGNGEIGITSGGTVRTNLLKGDLTKNNLIEVNPFFNSIFVKELPGQVILDALEFGQVNLPKVTGGYPQVSGITFDVDTSENSSVLLDSDGMFVNVTGKRRVSNVKINGVDLDLNKTYKCAMGEFLARGGDGYSMFDKYEVVNESLLTDTDALSSFIINNLKGKIPEEYSKFQGRINQKSHSLPNLLLLGFDNYEYTNNSIKFLTHLRVSCFPDDVENIRVIANIYNNSRLRNLQETKVEIDCTNPTKKSLDIYTFICSKQVNGPVSRVEFKSIELNENSIDPQIIGINDIIKNIQDQTNDIFSKNTYILEDSTLSQTDNKTITIEGKYSDSIDLTSNNSTLFFDDNGEKKSVPCSIEKASENKVKVICNIEKAVVENKISKMIRNIQSSEADLENNNLILVNDKNINIISGFNEGNSIFYISNSSGIPQSSGDINNQDNLQYNYFRSKKSSGKLSTGGIVAIIIPCLALLGIITALTFICRPKGHPESDHNKINSASGLSSSVNLNNKIN